MSATILIVDDEEFLREALAMDFEMRDFHVLKAASGREAFELVCQHKIDVVLTDVRMPNGDGLELLDRIKARDPAGPAVIFVSGYADLTVEEAYARGAEAIFPKPFNRKALAQAVDSAVLDAHARFGRKDLRVPSDLQGAIKVRSEGRNISGRIRNVGRGGMFIELADAFPACAEELDFRFKLPVEFGAPISGTGVVRWVRTEGADGCPPGCGIEFAGLDQECVGKVLELINESKVKAFIPKS